MAQSGLACLTGGQVVGGSNPLAPTNKTNQLASATVLILVNCIVFCIVGFG